VTAIGLVQTFRSASLPRGPKTYTSKVCASPPSDIFARAGADLQVCEPSADAENAHLKGVRQPSGTRRRNSRGRPLLGLRLNDSACQQKVILPSVRPYYPRCFPPGQLEFITTSTYWRTPLFRSERFCQEFVATLDAVRTEFAFLLMGWVLMPEHFHVLLKPEPADSTPKIVKQLKQRTASRILGALREHEQHPWCHRMLRSFRLPTTVHSQARHRVWERRYYPFNVYSEQKLREKLDYMHANPVKRGLVSSPEEWPWSSFRFYDLNDASVLRMDRLA